MDSMGSDQIPDRVKNRVQTDGHAFIERSKNLKEKYRYGSESSHEPVKDVQKEIDGMARLLCALATNDNISGDIKRYLEIYREEVGDIRELEQEVVSELPERERDN